MIAAVIIASGFSRRMGRSKLDLELGGRTFLQRAIDAATGARGIERCLVVVRPEDASKVPASGSSSGVPIEPMLNPHAAEGQSASIRLASERLAADPEVEAAIFSVVDQPFLTSTVFELLIDASRARPDAICVSSYAGQRGNPALFPRVYFPELCILTGDVGGRDVIRRHPEAVHEVSMPDPAAGQDVDTWADYERAVNSLAAG